MPADPRDCDDAVLERLPQRLEDGARKLRQLVHEENAEVREGDLARARARAAADDRGRRRAVMGRTKRRRRDERPARRQQAGDRVDAGDLESLLPRQCRQDARQPPRQHRLARSGRPHEQEVVRAGSGDLERTSSAFLSAYLREIGEQRRLDACSASGSNAGASISPRKYATTSPSVPYRNGLDARESGLGADSAAQTTCVEPRAASTFGDGERARDRADPPVERELTDSRVLGQPLGRELPRRAEHGERDREIEPGALLAEAPPARD